MAFSWPVFLVGLLLGILQLAVGVIIGRAISIDGRGGGSSTADHQRLRLFTVRLRQLVSSVADEVGNHHARMEEVNNGLGQHLQASQRGESDEAENSWTGTVLSTVAEIMQINERLQSRLSAAENKLQQQAVQIESHVSEARTDPLTGLPNRRAFDDELVRRVAEWSRKRSTFCLMMVDADRFKDLNDRYGHPAGDHVLRSIAEVLRGTCREMDLLARIGGEEFAAILPSTNSRDARRAAQRVLTAVADHPFEFEGHKLRVTVSVGLTAVREGDDGFLVLKRADEALYASKNAGRDCGHFHTGRRCLPIEMDRRLSPPGTAEEPLKSADGVKMSEDRGESRADARPVETQPPEEPRPGPDAEVRPTGLGEADATTPSADGPSPAASTDTAGESRAPNPPQAADESSQQGFADKEALVAMFGRGALQNPWPPGRADTDDDPKASVDPVDIGATQPLDLQQIQERLQDRLAEVSSDDGKS